MATVHVFVGQCGNQLGSAFLDHLVHEARVGSDEVFASHVSATHFRPSPPSTPPTPRCVMIDMEPKVIESVLSRTARVGAYHLHPHQCLTRDEGSGNNWAFGYFAQGGSRRADIAESLRRESESCGAVGAFHVLHSVAGGTGSGVGALVSDALREAFPRALRVHAAVWPRPTGEVVTQSYNAVLAASAMRESADAVLVLPNAAARDGDMCRRLLDMHLPTGVAACGRRLRMGGLSDVVDAVASDPARLFFAASAVAAEGWTAALRAAARRVADAFLPDAPALWSLRGPRVWDEAAQPVGGGAKWHTHEKPLDAHTAHLTVFGAKRRIGADLTTTLEQAEALLQVRAFTHHYARFGVEEEDIRDAIVRMWDTAMMYK